MSLDLLSVASLLGSPIGYVAVGFALYKVYNRILSTERYAKRANHNSTVLLKALIKRNLVDSEDLKDMELEPT